MKKIVMAATLLSIVTGGEVSALAAKTQHSVAKITHVKVTKHKVTGYTTAQSHVKLMKLKHGEKVSATANKHGKFTLKVKSNNLTKLKFKLKATKTGLKARTYTHKVKKAVQSIDDGATTETQTAPAVVKPDSSSADKKPASTHKEKPLSPKVVMQVMSLQDHFNGVLKEAQQKVTDATNKKSIALKGQLAELNSLRISSEKVKADLAKEQAKPIGVQEKNTVTSLTAKINEYKAQLGDSKYKDATKELDAFDSAIQDAVSNREKVAGLLKNINDFLNGTTTQLPAPLTHS
ncbi:hypothetical protein ACFQ44_04205 [Levilactobacillus lanxiensis]|uniref:Bacterial Ig domain-containing protein n=2 Tax=Levilactobacillus lanxiensis TaxID=2799568 RepID=A0ABW4D1T5_9LACO|nr:hypothetical protein [Levilactobacillus lanxiensis]